MIKRQEKNDLCWSGDEVTRGFLGLDCTEDVQQVHNFATILRHCSKGKYVVEIEIERDIDIVNKGSNILLRTLVEGNNSGN